MAAGNPELLLRQDVSILPLSQVDEALRARLQTESGQHVVSRRRGRATSVAVSQDTAELLHWFARPKTLVDTVIELASERQLPAEPLLRDVLPVVEAFLDKGILVLADEAAEPAQEWQPGERFGDWTIVRALQILDDTELYQVQHASQGPGALKLQREPSHPASVEKEAGILASLPPGLAPRLLERGKHPAGVYLLLEWCRGVDSAAAAAEWRRVGSAGRRGLLKLCCHIAESYARLHEAGVLHGDVHPRNVLVDRDGSVRLIDFGCGRRLAEPSTDGAGRAGVPVYYEPEYACSLLAGDEPLATSAKGEQFALCALLYYLVCGVHYSDFGLERRELYQRIAEARPEPFAARGMTPWPQLESVLRRGLAAEPRGRFASLRDLAAALARVSVPSRPRRRSQPRLLKDLTDHLVSRASLDGVWMSSGLAPAPVASVTFGAAGLAYALYRIACARQDGEILALADVWVHQARRSIERADGFYNSELGVAQRKVGQASPFHTASGIAAVQAFIAKARGDGPALKRAVDEFVIFSDRPTDSWDLTLGRSGSLLLCALLRDAVDDLGQAPPESLDQLGKRLCNDLWGHLDRSPELPLDGEEDLGVAHGWAGFLYATLQWHRASGSAAPSSLQRRLAELARLGCLLGRGRRWRWRAGEGWVSGTGWCNGSAGLVFLWSLAARLSGEVSFRDLAVDAAWDTWQSAGGPGNLCCGLTGRAYALLHVARHSADPIWPDRARQLAHRAASSRWSDTEYRHSLFKGEAALAVLGAELENPKSARMPFFEEEGHPVGWPQSASSGPDAASAG